MSRADLEACDGLRSSRLSNGLHGHTHADRCGHGGPGDRIYEAQVAGVHRRCQVVEQVVHLVQHRALYVDATVQQHQDAAHAGSTEQQSTRVTAE